MREQGLSTLHGNEAVQPGLELMPSPNIWPLMLALVLAEMTCSFESNMIYAAISTLYKLSPDPGKVGWVITAFLLTAAGAAAVCARLGDIYGRRRMLLIMLGIAALGSVISAMTSSLEGVIFGRTLQGASMAILPLCIGLVRESLPPQRVGFGIGLLGGTYGLGSGLGLLIGGVIVDRFSWQSIFICSAVFAVLSMLCAWRLIPPRRDGGPLFREPLDIWGGVLFVPAVALVLLAISKGKEWGWAAPVTWVTLACGLSLLAFWVFHELRQTRPLIEVRLLGQRQVGLANAVYFLLGFGPYMAPLVIMPLLQQPTWTLVGLGASATLAGLVKFPANIIGVVAGPWAGHLTERRGDGGRAALIYGLIIALLPWIALLFYHGSVWFVAACIVVSLPAMVVTYTAIANLIVEAVPADRTSEASGLAQVIRSMGMAVGAQTIAFLFATDTVSNPALGRGTYPSEGAYSSVFAVIVAVASLALILGLVLAWKQESRRIFASKNAVTDGRDCTIVD